MQHVIIGSRGSDLALWQANHVKAKLEALGAQVSIQIITTQGDAIQHLSFDKMEGKGFFTKEIEEALLSKSIDLAVHSHKDLETTSPEGLMIAAVSEREDPADLLLIRKEAADNSQKWNLKQNAIVGTGSARRKAQVVAHRPDCTLKDLRGNVPTRINKLREGQYDAILIAAAGIERLKVDISEFTVHKMDVRDFVPAPAQGVLGLQIRENEPELAQLIAKLNVEETEKRIAVERGILRALDGGCQLPLGVYCDQDMQTFVAFAETWQQGTKHFSFAPEEANVEHIVQQLRKS